MIKKLAAVGLLIIATVLAVIGVTWWTRKTDPRGKGEIKNNYLGKYDFDYLRQNYKNIEKDLRFEVLGKIGAVESRRGQEYDFDTRQIRFWSNGKWVTGMMNYHPEKSSLSKVIIMVRGYAETAGYYSGSGSWRVADELAKEGYATISIDFLGYGGSENESTDVLEARFEKVVSLLDLIDTVKSLPWVDKSKIGIWAHSNGGQIVLSGLEISGEGYPTVLWAPMTNPFPQSLIETADEGEERQKATDFVNLFLKSYDGRRYAFENYLEWIEAPVLILQGTADEWCRVEWQEELVGRLTDLGKEVKLTIYPQNDHNLSRDWKGAVEETRNWFEKNI